jgi:beta-phosphoglucomutase-like phosphatase (HAD superfamily)
LEYIIKYNVNYAIVTNTNRDIVNALRDKCPLLAKLNKWITREDYNLPKPNKECYELALKTIYNNEAYIIGFENTISGYNALKKVCHCNYVIPDSFNYTFFKKQDVYIINDYNQVFQ